MPQIHLYEDGEEVVMTGPPMIRAIVRSKTHGSVTVDFYNVSNGSRGTTQWSPQTIVRKYYLAEKAAEKPVEAPSQPVVGKPLPKPASPPQKPLQKPTAKMEKPAEPKAKPQLDVFGVRVGTMASAVNAFLLEKRKGITVEDILANVKGSKKDNVNSHLRRMVRDGLITNSGEGKTLVVSVPKGVK